MKKRLAVITLLASVLAAGALPFAGTARAATHTNSDPALFNRTRFVVDLGVAFYAFHHWCYNPQKAGAFKKAAAHQKKDIIKCGLALLFTLNRVGAARKAANTSSSKTLKVLVTPINAIYSAFGSVGSKMKSGTYNPLDLVNLNSKVGAVSGAAKVKDIPVSVPGT